MTRTRWALMLVIMMTLGLACANDTRILFETDDDPTASSETSPPNPSMQTISVTTGGNGGFGNGPEPPVGPGGGPVAAIECPPADEEPCICPPFTTCFCIDPMQPCAINCPDGFCTQECPPEGAQFCVLECSFECTQFCSVGSYCQASCENGCTVICDAGSTCEIFNFGPEPSLVFCEADAFCTCVLGPESCICNGPGNCASEMP